MSIYIKVDKELLSNPDKTVLFYVEYYEGFCLKLRDESNQIEYSLNGFTNVNTEIVGRQ